jgi:transcriptional regulator with XRE-family HTH domain/anti-sigma regulatory factor (Ser/Thr protein kinase)
MSAAEGAHVVSLAERLKSRREQLGLSQAQAARELDVARTAYRLWEMEAAKPQPDRWRLISRWLGVSVTTMLLADDLDGAAPGMAALSGGPARPESGWDDAGDPRAYFAKARTLIEEGIESGFLGSDHGQELLAIMGRAEEESVARSEAWEPARLQKRYRVDPAAPGKARQAVDFVGGDLPSEKLQAARLLASELVSNSVKHGSKTDPMIAFQIEVDRKRLRVEVRDAAGSPTLGTPDSDGGYGLAFVERLSSRWATERQDDGNLTWFEISLPAPGVKPERP